MQSLVKMTDSIVGRWNNVMWQNELVWARNHDQLIAIKDVLVRMNCWLLKRRPDGYLERKNSHLEGHYKVYNTYFLKRINA